ncbi:MAG TPA: polymer-forming cytoskeletal protein [Aggregatilineales bacterium]|nr:polymer-forming cytoskeletal protein [Aggregatilineales bacterium]
MSIFGNRRQTDIPAPALDPKPSVLTSTSAAMIGFETVLGRNSVLEGSFRCNANVRIDGVFSGQLEITGNMLVGETARITADINARNISIAGTVNGNVNGRKVQILRTGRVKGDIRATALTTEEGAFIDGKITMIGEEPKPEGVLSSPLESSPIVTDSPPTAAG